MNYIDKRNLNSLKYQQYPNRYLQNTKRYLQLKLMTKENNNMLNLWQTNLAMSLTLCQHPLLNPAKIYYLKQHKYISQFASDPSF